MGDKAAARKLAKEQGVRRCRVARAVGVARGRQAGRGEIGFPVIIKAEGRRWGGGMARRHDVSVHPSRSRLAKQEAGSRPFNSTRSTSRSIGAAAPHRDPDHWATPRQGENLCERGLARLQRRHQKTVEGSDVARVDQTLRREIGDATVKLAESIGYVGARDTSSFLLDTDGSFYFREMNTRIQVEHPVTEVSTNFDLVNKGRSP